MNGKLVCENIKCNCDLNPSFVSNNKLIENLVLKEKVTRNEVDLQINVTNTGIEPSYPSKLVIESDVMFVENEMSCTKNLKNESV